jgi:hypothetical protein
MVSVIAFIEDILGLLEDVDLVITFSNSIVYSDVQIISLTAGEGIIESNLTLDELLYS